MCWMPRARSVREGDRSHPSLRDAGHGFARGAGSKIFIASACFVRTSGARVGEICVPFPSSCAYVDLLLFITNLFVTPLVWHDGLSRPSHSLLEAVNRVGVAACESTGAIGARSCPPNTQDVLLFAPPYLRVPLQQYVTNPPLEPVFVGPSVVYIFVVYIMLHVTFIVSWSRPRMPPRANSLVR